MRHAFILLYNHRYIDFSIEYEQIYINVFSKYLSRHSFEKLVNISYIRHINKNDIFKQKGDLISNLCIIVKGRIQVLREIDDTNINNNNRNNNNNSINLTNDIIKNRDTNIDNIDNIDNDIVSSMSTYVNPAKYIAVTSTPAFFNHNDIEFNFDNIDNIDNKSISNNTGNTDTSKTSKTSNKTDNTMKLNLLLNPNFINVIHENEFIEALQWVAFGLDPDLKRFDVGLRALDDCIYIKWERENLVDLIENDYQIYVAIQAILGVHTAKLLLRSRQYTKEMEKLSKNFKKNKQTNQNDLSKKTQEIDDIKLYATDTSSSKIGLKSVGGAIDTNNYNIDTPRSVKLMNTKDSRFTPERIERFGFGLKHSKSMISLSTHLHKHSSH